MRSTLQTLPSLLRILGDRTRLRTLWLLAREPLGVGELARILGVTAPRLSNHLRILREAGLITDRKEGSWTFVSLAKEKDSALPTDLWNAVRRLSLESADHQEDEARLVEVLEARRAKSRAFFDRVAAEWDVIGSDFRTGIARQRVAASLVPRQLCVADVGCGTGYLAQAVAPLVSHMILVDHSPAMLEKAQRNLAGQRTKLEFRQGELDALPLKNGEVDAILAGLVLHHVPDLLAFAKEALRALKPGGTLVIEDLLPHTEGWMREAMADLRLGLSPDEIQSLLDAAGFIEPMVELLEDSYRPSRKEGGTVDLPLFIVRARKPMAMEPTASGDPKDPP